MAGPQDHGWCGHPDHAFRSSRSQLLTDLRRTRPYAKVLAYPLDEQRHLIGDQARVGAEISQYRETTAIAGCGDEQERRLQLDDRLTRAAAVEMLAKASGQALESGRDGGQMLRILAGQPG